MTAHSTAIKSRLILFISFLLFCSVSSIFFIINKSFTQKDVDDFNQYFKVDEIPRFNINTTTENASKSREYTNATFELDNKNFSGKFKVRGNSSRYVSMKYNASLPYKIKLEEKQSLLGLGESKSFVLLPNFIDPSGVRQFFHLNAASYILDDWSPKAKYVELYIDDNYSGLYVLAESIGQSDSRISYKNNLGFIVEMDLQEESRFITEPYVGEDDFAIDYQIITNPRAEQNNEESKKINVSFELKDPDSFTETDKNHKEYIIDTVTNLYKKSDNFTNLEELKIDIDSFVKYFMLQEIFGSYDVGVNSVYYWNDGEQTHAGPFWDADRSASNYNTVGFINDGYSIKNPIYVNLMKNEEFREKIKAAFLNFYQNDAPKLKNALMDLKNNTTLKASWERNEALYHRLSGNITNDFFVKNKNMESRKTFEEQIDYIIGFYFDGFEGITFWEENPKEQFFEPRIEWMKNHIDEW